MGQLSFCERFPIRRSAVSTAGSLLPIMYTSARQPFIEPNQLRMPLNTSTTFRKLHAVVAVLIVFAVLLSGCGKREEKRESYSSVSPVPPREGTPIDQKTALPKREKVILKKPPSP